MFNLTSQINRSCISIPANIAEGCGRETQKELIGFFYIPSGSAHELEYLLLVSSDLGFIGKKETKETLSSIAEIK